MRAASCMDFFFVCSLVISFRWRNKFSENDDKTLNLPPQEPSVSIFQTVFDVRIRACGNRFCEKYQVYFLAALITVIVYTRITLEMCVAAEFVHFVNERHTT